MVVFPNCKINLGLRITSKRADGYHNLETVFYPLKWEDALEAVKSRQDRFIQTGIAVPGNSNDNVCLKAVSLLKKDFPRIGALDIHLHKTIPTGAGLGGGSADGAFMLRLLNRLYQLQLSEEQLLEYSLQLGSDCPFFIVNQPCFATGRGEILQRVSLNLADFSFLIIHPCIHVDTGWAFTQITPAVPERSVPEITRQPVDTWRNLLINDFEPPVFQKYPEIGGLKELLYKKGAIYAAMSGSGSAVFGIFKKGALPELSPGKGYSIKKIT